MYAGSLIQAEDRCHRIGQLNTVKVYYFFAKDSIDELLWPILKTKIKVLSQIMEGKVVADGKSTNIPRKENFFTRVVTSSSSSSSTAQINTNSSSNEETKISSKEGQVTSRSTSDQVIYDLTQSDDEEDEDVEIEKNDETNGVAEGNQIIEENFECDVENREPSSQITDAQDIAETNREMCQLLTEATDEHAEAFGYKEMIGNESDEEYEEETAALADNNDDDDSVVFTEAPDPLAVWYLRWRKQLPAIRESGATDAFNSAIIQAHHAINNTVNNSVINGMSSSSSSLSVPTRPMISYGQQVVNSDPVHYNPNNIFLYRPPDIPNQNRNQGSLQSVSSSTSAILSSIGYKNSINQQQSSSTQASARPLMVPIRTGTNTNTNTNSIINANIWNSTNPPTSMNTNIGTSINSNTGSGSVSTNPYLRLQTQHVRPQQYINKAIAINNRYASLPFLSKPTPNASSNFYVNRSSNLALPKLHIAPIVKSTSKVESEIINLADSDDDD